MDKVIVFEGILKKYGAHVALQNIDASVSRGETIVLCGPSGSGKSTLLRTVNRLEPVDGGTIHVNGANIHDRSVNLNRYRSDIGFIAQSFNLFSNYNVIDNVTLGLRRVRGLDKQEARDQAYVQLKRLNAESLAHKFPNQLSGGQQQRVAIARALAMQPSIMLLDEPTSALDPELVGEVVNAMKDLALQGMTMLCVTHEMGFARQAADRVWFLEQGRLVQDLDSKTFFTANDNERVRRFLNQVDKH